MLSPWQDSYEGVRKCDPTTPKDEGKRPFYPLLSLLRSRHRVVLYLSSPRLGTPCPLEGSVGLSNSSFNIVVH